NISCNVSPNKSFKALVISVGDVTPYSSIIYLTISFFTHNKNPPLVVNFILPLEDQFTQNYLHSQLEMYL
ncbi:hypothetical protein, partial [Thomasclavelia ramosa]|uniref:hypothetical protein n=1 Tax=Thomasclavelia ramosa TaxID=1547 RepID=UPI003DA67291